MKRLLACLLLLCLLTPLAWAEDVPVWPEVRLLWPHADWGKTRYVYPHPEEFTPETGKVGFAGDVWCYGYVAVPSLWKGWPDTWSLLVRYEKDNGGERIAWLTGIKPDEVAGQDLPELTMAEGEVIDLSGMAVTDDPCGKQTTLGTMTGAGGVVAYLDDGWAVVSGLCELANGKGEWPVLAFAARSEVDAYRRADLYLPHLDAIDLVSATPLNLPEDASDIWGVHELPDGTFLIAYRCEGSSRL